jgi:Ribonuclease G/E
LEDLQQRRHAVESVKSKISVTKDYLKAELYHRETSEETKDFLRSVAAESLARGCSNLLICVHDSRAIFKVQDCGIRGYLDELRSRPNYRIALVADSDEVHAAHEYIRVLARQHGIALDCFRDEASAVKWLGSH